MQFSMRPSDRLVAIVEGDLEPRGGETVPLLRDGADMPDEVDEDSEETTAQPLNPFSRS